MSGDVLVAVIFILALLFGLFFELFYFFGYPLVKMKRCKVGDVYYKNIKDDDPFKHSKDIRKEYIILDIQGRYIKYMDVDVYISFDGDEMRREWTTSSHMYPFFCYIVQGLKKK